MNCPKRNESSASSVPIEPEQKKRVFILKRSKARRKGISYKLNGLDGKNTFYTVNDIEFILQRTVNEDMIVRKTGRNQPYYYNVPSAFDIEVTSYYEDENGESIDYKTKRERQKTCPLYNPEKRARMYVWQFGINGVVIIGRTYEEMLDMFTRISKTLELSQDKRLIVYIHSLEYEMSFIKGKFTFTETFSLDTRRIIKALTSLGIEFRCSYTFSGYSLNSLAKNLIKYKVQKMVGDLDYSLLRNEDTVLTDKEILYCVNDVRVVMAYIQQEIEAYDNNISRLELTNTGRVRTHCKNHTLRLGKGNLMRQNRNYSTLMKELSIQSVSEFNMLRRAFQGGFTHGNAYNVGRVLYNVSSYDFTSSYPYVMVSEKFPMSKGVKIDNITPVQFKKYVIETEDYLSIFDALFIGLRPRLTNDNPISSNKVLKGTGKGLVINNGRVVQAEQLAITITNIDFNIYKEYYTWDDICISELYLYEKGYLPTEFVQCILELYQDKTVLKDVQGKEIEYQRSKGMLNSCYGMAVTNPLKPNVTFDDTSKTWVTESLTADAMAERLKDYNASYNRFLYYAWGVFITAYARRNLFSAITLMGNDYVYSDTDSVKVLNHSNHAKYFQAYNMLVQKKLKDACTYHGLPFELVAPKTQKGKVKMLGVWDYEGTYDMFKTIGAKRYMHTIQRTLPDGKQDNYPFTTVVAGINSKYLVPFLWDTLAQGDIDKAFLCFADGLFVPAEYSGKSLHTYLDAPVTSKLTDYQGHTVTALEESGLHLEPVSFNMSQSAEYINYLANINEDGE